MPFAQDRGHVNVVRSGEPDEPRMLRALRYLLEWAAIHRRAESDDPATNDSSSTWDSNSVVAEHQQPDTDSRC